MSIDKKKRILNPVALQHLEMVDMNSTQQMRLRRGMFSNRRETERAWYLRNQVKKMSVRTVHDVLRNMRTEDLLLKVGNSSLMTLMSCVGREVGKS